MWRMEFESLADRLIRESIERGEFDDLPGAGKPIAGLDKPYEPHWWLKSFIDRERSKEASVATRDEIHAQLGSVWQLGSEVAVRARVEQLNAEINTLNQRAQTDFAGFDVEDVVSAWKDVARAKLRSRRER